MLDIPEDLSDLLALINRTSDRQMKLYGYKLLWSKIMRYGFRWDYYV